MVAWLLSSGFSQHRLSRAEMFTMLDQTLRREEILLHRMQKHM